MPLVNENKAMTNNSSKITVHGG